MTLLAPVSPYNLSRAMLTKPAAAGSFQAVADEIANVLDHLSVQHEVVVPQGVHIPHAHVQIYSCIKHISR